MSIVTQEREVKHNTEYETKVGRQEGLFLGFRLSLDRISGVALLFFGPRGE